jgi:hypothetical protein
MKYDAWLMQDDVLARLKTPGAWLKAFVPIHEERRSYVEDFVWQCFPISQRYAKTALGQASWPQSMSMVAFQLIRRTSRDFLSRKVRHRLALEHGRRAYMTEDGRTVAQVSSSGSSFETIERIVIRKDSLAQVLNGTPSRLALWLFRSYRFSERALPELGLRNSTQCLVRGDSFVCHRRVFRVLHDVPGRERMKSGTVMTGRFVWKPD